MDVNEQKAYWRRELQKAYERCVYSLESESGNAYREYCRVVEQARRVGVVRIRGR